MLVKVKDKKTGNIRTVTQKAYAALGPKVYEKLGFVNDDGSDIGSTQLPNSNTPQVQRSVKGAAPVVVKTQLVAPTPVVEKESIVVLDEPGTTEHSESELPVKRKPGRQPGSKNKSISSNSTADEK